MNHAYKKYQAKPEAQQQLHLRKSSKKLLQNYFFNGGEDKDDVIIRQIIQRTQNVPFTESDAQEIERLYKTISGAKKTKFSEENNFETIYNSDAKEEKNA